MSGLKVGGRGRPGYIGIYTICSPAAGLLVSHPPLSVMSSPVAPSLGLQEVAMDII